MHLGKKARWRLDGHRLDAEGLEPEGLVEPDGQCIALGDGQRDHLHPRPRAGLLQRHVNQGAAYAPATRRFVREHADEVGLVACLGLGRELDRDGAHQAVVHKGAQGLAEALAIGNARGPPRQRRGGAFVIPSFSSN